MNIMTLPIHPTIVLLGLCFISAPAIGAPLFNINSLTLQQAEHFEAGDPEREILTVEHASVWSWGDLFLFYDHTEQRTNDDDDYYYEVSPRFSLSLFGLNTRSSATKDILIATTLERGSNDFEANLIGLGVTWNLPHFAHLSTNLYYRDNPDLSGNTWQITAAWSLPFKTGSLDWLLDGYIDSRGGEANRVTDFNFNPQLKLDVGKFIDLPGKVYAGIEYYHWNNKFGLDGVDERVVSPLLQARFSF